MGMTIDKTIEFYNGLECYTPQAKDARDVAIDTMRKYQKIKEQVDIAIDKENFAISDARLIQIREVIEDGSNNQHN